MAIIFSIRRICDTARPEHAERWTKIFSNQRENAMNDTTVLSEHDLNDNFQAEALKSQVVGWESQQHS